MKKKDYDMIQIQNWTIMCLIWIMIMFQVHIHLLHNSNKLQSEYNSVVSKHIIDSNEIDSLNLKLMEKITKDLYFSNKE